MQQRKVVRTILGTTLVLSFGVFGHYVVSTSTTMGTETELAGMSYTLDQYCSVQAGAAQSNPEAIVAFSDDTTDANGAADTAISGTAVADATPEPTEAPAADATPKPESEYANVGISIAADYVNIRKKPSTDDEIVGKLYRGSAATITKTEGDWVKIESGSVTGYIRKDYLAIGYSAEKLIDDFGTKWATVTTETLKVREEKNTDCAVLTLISGEEKYQVLKEDDEWAKICVDGDTNGYVSKEYVKMSVQFKKAVSIEEEREEERRKAAAEEAERKAEEEAARRRAEENAQKSSSGNNSSSGNTSNAGNKSSSNGNKSSSSGSGSGGSSNSGSNSSNTSGSGGSSSSGGSSESNTGGGGASGSSESSEGGGGSVLGSGDGSAVVSYALQFVGNPYVYGGSSLTHGTDCSGFTMSIFKKFGISLPRTSGEQSGTGKKVKVSEAQPGDLIFYTSGGRVNHVAIYIGGGRVVHASNPNTGITTSNMRYRTPYCARRVIG